MHKDLIVAGTNLRDFGLVISGEGVYNAAERDVEVISVAGRNGDLTHDLGRYKNIPVKYPASIARNFPDHADGLRAFLSSLIGYQRIEDGYHPEQYRMGRFTGPVEFAVGVLGRCGEVTLSFDCMPQRFLKIGENPIEIVEPTSLCNPTRFPALPLIRVFGTGAGSVTVSNITVAIKTMEDTLELDSDTMNAYHVTDSGVMAPRNGSVYAPVYPELLPGENLVNWTGNISKLEIIPRWWTL